MMIKLRIKSDHRNEGTIIEVMDTVGENEHRVLSSKP